MTNAFHHFNDELAAGFIIIDDQTTHTSFPFMDEHVPARQTFRAYLH
jgi:hypothetical protein